jgi:hypothetical protein
LSKDHARAGLVLLQRKLKHKEVRSLFNSVESASRGQGTAPAESLVRIYVQSLIDQGDFDGASRAMDKYFDDHSTNPRVLALRARIAKQGYIEDDSNPSLLVDAIELYSAAYQADPTDHYPLINVATLKARSVADKVALPENISARSAQDDARQVLSIVNANEARDMWAYASAMEASLLLDDFDEAATWLERYLGAAGQIKGADAFEYNSTVRQLTEVLRFDSAVADQATILEPLRNTLTRLNGSVVDAVPSTSDGFYTDPARTTAERAVVTMRSDDGSVWAGVLVSGGDLGLGSAVVIITPDTEFRRARTISAIASVAGTPIPIDTKPEWFSPRFDLDIACLPVAQPLARGVETAPICADAPLAGAEVFAISFADSPVTVRDNQGALLGAEGVAGQPHVTFGAHYLERALRGAPVFNDRWQLIAVQLGGKPSEAGGGLALLAGTLIAGIAHR